MAILSFQKPDKVFMIEADDFRGTFEFRLWNLATALPSAMPSVVFCSPRWKVSQSPPCVSMVSTMSFPHSPAWSRT